MNNRIKQLIASSGKTFQEVGKEIYPDKKFPGHSLKRVLEGNGQFNVIQIQKLAAILGVDVCSLFKPWKAEYKTADSVHIFRKGKFRAELNTKTWVTRVFKEDSLFFEDVIFSPGVQISEYISKLEEIIS